MDEQYKQLIVDRLRAEGMGKLVEVLLQPDTYDQHGRLNADVVCVKMEITRPELTVMFEKGRKIMSDTPR